MKTLLTTFTLFIMSISAAFSQEANVKAFEKFSVAAVVSSTGLGVDAATTLSQRFALRAGFSLFSYSKSSNYSIAYQPLDLPGTDYNVPLETKVNLFNGKILADYFPAKNSTFFLSAGLYFGDNKMIKIDGEAKDPIIIGGTIIKPVNGVVTAGLQTWSVKPYFGLGFGRSIPKSRVGFRFELGAMYLGKVDIYSTDPTVKKIIDDSQKELIDLLNKYSFYPVISFNVTVKLTK